jgi:hypothetical protein
LTVGIIAKSSIVEIVDKDGEDRKEDLILREAVSTFYFVRRSVWKMREPQTYLGEEKLFDLASRLQNRLKEPNLF